MLVPKRLLPSQGTTPYTFRFKTWKPLPSYTPLQICMIDSQENAVLLNILYEENKEDYIVYGPEMDISHIMVSPSKEQWELADITIKYNEKSVYFPTYTSLYKDAFYLLPVDKPDIDMKPIYDAEYLALKEKLLNTTIELTVLGSFLTAILSSMEKGYSFALGGSLGYIYISLLELGVDRIASKQIAFIDQTTRLGIMFILAASIISKYHDKIYDDKMYFIIGLLGFMTHRIAFITAYLKK